MNRVTRQSKRRSGGTSQLSRPAVAELGSKWSFSEKNALFDGLRIHGLQNLSRIQMDFLPQRQLSDVSHFISKLKMKKYAGGGRAVKKAPIELWLAEAEALTQEGQDHSENLAQVFNMFGTLEPHDVLPQEVAPDWGAIYNYMAILMRGGMPPVMNPIDAVIVLDMIDSLAIELRQCETVRQRLLMQCKYKLMSQNVDINNKSDYYQKIRQALEDDFGENADAEGSEVNGGTTLPKKVLKSPGAAKSNTDLKSLQTDANAEANSTDNKDSTSAKVSDTSDLQNDITGKHAHSGASKQATSVPVFAGYSLQSNSDKKACTDKTCHTPIHTDTSAVSTQSVTVNNADSSPVSSDHTEQTITDNLNEAPSTSTNQNEAPSVSNASPRKRHQKEPVDVRPKKTPLYSLNPFCIPIVHLKFPPK